MEMFITHLRGHNNVIVMLESIDNIEQSSLQLPPKNMASLLSLSIRSSGYQQVLYRR